MQIDFIRSVEARHRKQDLGNKNLVGKNVSEERKKQGLQQKELLARIQVAGVDISPSGLSKIEANASGDRQRTC